MIGLDTIVEIIETTEVSDGAGGWKKTETVKATVPANISRIGAIESEVVVAGKLKELATHRILIELTPLKMTDRIRHGTRVWEIKGIENHRDHHLEIRGLLL